jgi:hypothetical protein
MECLIYPLFSFPIFRLHVFVVQPGTPFSPNSPLDFSSQARILFKFAIIKLIIFLQHISYPNSPSSASIVLPDTLGLPPEPLGPPLQGLADKQEPLVEIRRSSQPASRESTNRWGVGSLERRSQHRQLSWPCCGCTSVDSQEPTYQWGVGSLEKGSQHQQFSWPCCGCSGANSQEPADRWGVGPLKKGASTNNSPPLTTTLLVNV